MQTMKLNTLIFDEAGRPRSGWRVMIFLLAWTLCSTILGIVAYVTFLGGRTQPPDRLEEFALTSSVSLIATLVAGWMCGRWLEGLPFQALGAALSLKGFKNFTIGMLVGAGTLSMAVAIAAALGNYDFELNRELSVDAIVRGLLISLLVLAVAAAFEEALFRGYMFQTLTRSGLSWLALLLTAAVFGAVHLGNPGSGNISTVDTVIAGLLFGLAYLK